MAGEPALALFHLRYACEGSPYSYPIWNLFCEAATDLGSVKQAQKAAYVLKHTIDCIPLKLVHGHSLAINVRTPLCVSRSCCQPQSLFSRRHETGAFLAQRCGATQQRSSHSSGQA